MKLWFPVLPHECKSNPILEIVYDTYKSVNNNNLFTMKSSVVEGSDPIYERGKKMTFCIQVAEHKTMKRMNTVKIVNSK